MRSSTISRTLVLVNCNPSISITFFTIFKFLLTVPCDVDANCHINATCEWYENEMRHACTCNQGFQGDGYNCELINTSCAYVSSQKHPNLRKKKLNKCLFNAYTD